MSDTTDLSVQDVPSSLRDRFTKDEWPIVRSAPFAAGLVY
jgi:hypothetical protein